ncbi:hypothetical protein VNO77_22850 [Canavalia gladiata]|uniref:Uncharacterized protein n=1 Tax=Canavalia gladiata TaxID=3824 RepID=A0AAN9L8L8_CANGL
MQVSTICTEMNWFVDMLMRFSFSWEWNGNNNQYLFPGRSDPINIFATLLAAPEEHVDTPSNVVTYSLC